jgi:hypothetical protein
MELREIRRIAKAMGVTSKGLDKIELVRAIQRAEGNFDCFATAVEEECDQEACLWREDCFVEAIALER